MTCTVTAHYFLTLISQLLPHWVLSSSHVASLLVLEGDRLTPDSGICICAFLSLECPPLDMPHTLPNRGQFPSFFPICTLTSSLAGLLKLHLITLLATNTHIHLIFPFLFVFIQVLISLKYSILLVFLIIICLSLDSKFHEDRYVVCLFVCLFLIDCYSSILALQSCVTFCCPAQ